LRSGKHPCPLFWEPTGAVAGCARPPRQAAMYAGYYATPAAYGTGYAAMPQAVVAPQQATPATPEIGNAAQISVSGCTHVSVGPIVRGNYSVDGSNHNKPAYRKEQKVSGLDVMLYYWDERDGVEFSGWWFGPKIGGDQVWAYQPTRATQTPPRTGWKVPYDGAVDQTLVLAPRGLAAQQEALKQQAEARQQQILAEKMRQAEEQKKRVEEARQRAEENKKKIEEANRRRVEEEKKRQEEVKKRAEEQKSVLAIRQVLMKMKTANLDNFDAIHEEVAKVMEKELDKCGSMKIMIQGEHDKGWEQVKMRMEQLQAAKQKIQEQKRAAKEKAEIHVKELDDAVAAAEAAAAVLKEAVEKLTAEGADKFKLEQVKDLIASIDTATKEANDAYEVCTDLVRKIGNTFQALDPELKDLKEQNSRLMQRMAAVSMGKDTVIKSSTNSNEQALRRATAKAKLDKQMVLFSKYDANKDGVLDKKEIANYAKKEFSFTVPEPAMNSLLQVLVDEGAKGVKKANFHRVRIHVGMAREKAKDLKRRKAREAREKEIEEMKEAFKTKLAEAEQRIATSDEAIKKVEEAAKPMHLQGKEMKSAEMFTLVDDLEQQIKETRTPFEELKADIAGCKEGAAEEIVLWLNNQVKLLELKFAKLEPRLGLLGSSCLRFRETAKSRERSELKAVETKAKDMLRYHQKAKDMTADQLAEAIEGDGDTLSEDAFLNFFQTCEQEPVEGAENGHAAALNDEELRRLYKHWAEESDGIVQKETLVSRVRKYMKVMKTAALTDHKGIKESKSIRRLLEGEVVEALGTPQKEDEVDLMRLRVKAMNDSAEGWVTISGNQGTIFLKEGGHMFKVVKETILTETFSLEGPSSSKDPRRLRPGELVEVRTWMTKDEKSGLMRMKCKAVSDGAVGWATVVGNAGTVFLEVH